MFTEQDHEHLALAQDLMHWAAEIINGVMDRRRSDLTMQAISFLSEAKRDADLGVASVDGDDLAGSSSYLTNGQREIGMADKYLGWNTEGQAS